MKLSGFAFWWGLLGVGLGGVIVVHPAEAQWKLYGGFSAGYDSVSGSEYLGSPGGPELTINALVSQEITHWSFDLGFGWLLSHVGGTASDGRSVNMGTRAGTFDLGVRYRWGSHWQLGPAVNVAFGTDTTFSPEVGAAAITPFAGIQLIYETLPQPWALRFWSELSTDISLPDRRVVMGALGVQIGLPIQMPWEAGRESPLPEGEIHISQASAIRQEELRISLDPQKIFFSTASTQLRDLTAQTLPSLGAYLRENPETWGSLEISGHADRRGRFRYNLKLSRARAEAVRKALLRGGAEAEKISSRLKVEALSYLKPLDPGNNPSAWATNRRVELVFREVRDVEKIRAILDPLTLEAPWK